jgi:uncharacterized protein (TIGR03086 family)
MTTPVEQLADALDATGLLVANVHDEQWSDPTPCTEWNVQQLVNHMIIGNLLFAGILSGRPGTSADVAKAHLTSPLADRPVEAYRESADAVLTAFRRPGVLDEQFVVPFGPVPGIVAAHLRITEVLVHGWDLARATGQSTDFPDDIVEQELAFSRAKVGEIPPGRTPFAPEQPVAQDAAPIDRLAACLGRTVTK